MWPSAGAERPGTGRGILGGDDAALMLYRQPAVQPLQHHYHRSGVAGAVPTWQYLQGVPLELHGVVSGHATPALEAQDLPQVLTRLQGPEGRLQAFGRNAKAPVEPGQELLQHSPGLCSGGCSREPQFRGQPVLESSSRSLHTSLCLRREGEYQLYSQLLHGPAELGGRAGGLVFRAVLEDGVAVGVQGEGYAAALYQAL